MSPSRLPDGYPEFAYFLSAVVDSTGNYIVADQGNNSVWLYPAGGGAPIQVGTYAGGGMGYGDVYIRIVPGSPGSYILAEDESEGGGINLYSFTACRPSPVSCPELQTPNPLVASNISPYYVSGLAVAPGGYPQSYIITALGSDGGTPQILSVYFNSDSYVSQPMTFVPGFNYHTPEGIALDPVTGNYDFVDPAFGALFNMSSGPIGDAGIGKIINGEGLVGIQAVIALPVQQQAAPPQPAPVPPLVISGGTLPVGFAHEPYSASVGASGGVQPYSFTASGFPSGIGMNQYGAISGVTTATGSFTISVTVTIIISPQAPTAPWICLLSARRRRYPSLAEP